MVTQLPADEETTAQNGHRPWEWAAPCTLEKEGAKSVTARYLQSQKQTGCIPWRRNVISHREPMLNRSQYLFSDTASRTSPSIQHAGFSWLMCTEISSRKLFPENGKVQILCSDFQLNGHVTLCFNLTLNVLARNLMWQLVLRIL